MGFDAEGDVEGAEVVGDEFPRARGGDEENGIGYDDFVERDEFDEGKGRDDHGGRIV